MYHRLPASPSSVDTLDDELEKSSTIATASGTPFRRLSPLLCFVFCALCTLFNLVLALSGRMYGGDVLRSFDAGVTRQEIQLLRRPSHFIRFDEIPRPSPPLSKQFNNFPILLAQIDQFQPHRVFPDDARRYMSHIGTISPEEKRVQVSNTISTIVQFRAIDWGMESCELRLSLPASTSKVLVLPEQSYPISIYRLNATLPLDVGALSYASKPPRVAKVGDVHLAHGVSTVWHRKFHCLTEEILTFEIACSPVVSGDSCNLEWWQDKENPDPAVFLTQYATR